MRLPLNLFSFHGADNRSASLSSAAFEASSQAGPSSALLSNTPQAQSYDAHTSGFTPVGEYGDFYPSPFDTGIGDLGLGWNDSLLNELTDNTNLPPSFENTYPATPGPSQSMPAVQNGTDLIPSYYSPKSSLPNATIDEVEFGFDTYLPESSNPSFLSDRQGWASPAPEDIPVPKDIPTPAELPAPEEIICPSDCFDVTDLPLTVPDSSQGPPLLPTSYDTTPTTASHEDSLFEQYLAPYSPAATSVDACSPSWAVDAELELPAAGDLLAWLYAKTAVPSTQPVASSSSSSKRRLEDDDVVAQPATKRIREEGSYQGIMLPSLPGESSKRKHEDDEESIDEPLMKKRREEKRPALDAETQARRDSTETLRHHNVRLAGPEHGDAPTSQDTAKFSTCEVEGSEQAHSGSSSQTDQAETTPSEPIRCTRAGCTKTFGRKHERDRHVRSVHIKAKLPCPEAGCSSRLSRADALSRHLKDRHHYAPEHALRKAKAIEATVMAAIGWVREEEE